VDRGLLLGPEPDLLRYPLRWLVVRVDDGDQPGGAKYGPGEIARRGRGFGRITLPLQCGYHVVADLEFGHAVDELRSQAAVTDEVALGGGQQPQSVAVHTVQAPVPVDPLSGFLPGLRPRVVRHDVRIAEQGGHVIDVVRGHVAERQPGSFWMHTETVARPAPNWRAGFAAGTSMVMRWPPKTSPAPRQPNAVRDDRISKGFR
jgi:hypothetical protein